jgi:pilus assembly protein CpaF
MNAGVLINTSLILVMLFLVGVLIFFKLTEKRQPRKDPHELDKKYTIPGLIEYVKAALNEMTTSNFEHLGLSEDEYNRRMNQRIQLQKALKGCTHGDLHDKNFVKNTIFDLLLKTYGLNEDNINRIIPFNNKKLLTSQDKHDILLYLYKKKEKSNALTAMFEKHGLADLKKVIEDGETESYIVTDEDIDEVFRKDAKPLSFEDKLMIIVQRIYQEYKGFSVIDEIRDMKIDGVSGGVSGVPIDLIDMEEDANYISNQLKKKTIKYSHDSVWIFYKGKPVHLAYLSFGSEAELKRVCQNIYRYNNPGQLSDSNGFKVNEMKDGSRVVVVRPSFAESWAFFVRKFDVQSATLEQLIPETVGGRMLAINAIKYLVKGARILAITGAQGTGKTTLLMAMIKYIHGTYTIRVQEMAFELHLRKIYRDRNILSFRETETISGQAGLDVQKKTDGTVNILGEVATDPVAAWMIQMAQVASLFTIFTHHAKTFKDLVFSLRNSLLKTGMFSNEKIAEQQVVSVLNFDIHLKREQDGTRYIERITECIPLDLEEEYPTDFRNVQDPQERMLAFMETTTEYFRRTTDRKVFAERNIIEFRDGKYVAVHPISERNKQEMLTHMSAADQAEFKQFLEEYWG